MGKIQKPIQTGKWHTVFDGNGNVTEAFYDESFRRLLGFETEEEYANAQQTWTDSIHPDDKERLDEALADCMAKHPEGKDFEVEYRMMTKWGYRWFHDFGHCIRHEDGSLMRCDGMVFDIQEIKDFEHQQAHRDLRREVLDYVVSHEDEDPIELLKQFGEKLRNLFNCDQFICRDLEKTRIMVNSPEIEKTWSVPIGFCQQCQHFDAHHPMYKDGYTEMENCQEGWRGIPVYDKCPIKSSLTRIIYCNGRVAGYAAIHYLQDYHQFTEEDRETFAEFISNLSLVLSKYETKQELLKAQRQKDNKAQRIAENYARVLALEENFISVYDLDLESGKYEMFVKENADDEGVNSMTVNTGNFFEDTLKNVLIVIHPDDKDELVRVLSRDYVRERLDREGHFDYCYRLLVDGVTWWAKLRMAYKDAEKRRVIIGTFRADEEMAAKHAEEERHKAILQNNNRIMALEDNLESIYEVELESGRYLEYVKGDFYQNNIVQKLLPKGDYFADLRGNIDAVIYPEDRDGLFDVLDRESIRKALARTDRIEHYYRLLVGKDPIWFKIRIVYKDDFKHSVIIGVFNADEEVKEKHEDEHRRQILINQMAGDDGVFIVDCVHDTRKTIHDARRGIDNSQEQSGYSDFIKKHIMTNTAAPDRKMMLEVSQPEYMLDRLKTENEFSVRFRDVMTGRPQHFEMKVMKLSDTEVLQTFTNKDREVISSLISSSMEQEYFALYGVDLDFGQIQIIKDSPYFPQGGVGKVDDYTSSFRKFASYFSGETKEFFESISDIGLLKRRFATDNKYTYTYKASTGQWVNVSGLVLSRHEDGTPSLFAIGFSFSDSLESQVKDAQQQIQEDMHVIGGLANEYDTLYYVNLKESVFRVIACDGERFPQAAKVVGEGGNPFSVLQKYGTSELIHPEDRNQFADLTFDTFMAKLAHSKSFSLRYRSVATGSFQWWEMTVIKYEDIDEPANAVAIGFANRDAEIRSEQTLGRCYSVLGKDITPHAAINELLSLAGDYYDARRAYIFEISKEGYGINTYEWCKDGVEPMIEHLQNVPAKEFDGWMSEFQNHGAFCMDTLDDANTTSEGRAILEMQGISSLIAAPIMDGEKIVGFIGVDDPTKAKRQADLLKRIAIVAYSEILRRKENDEEHVTLQKLTDTFLSVYFADLSRDYLHTWKIDEEYKDEYGSVTYYSESMGGYVRNNIAVRDRERCIMMTSPEYVLEQFKTKDSFSIGMTDIMLGYERDIVMDYVKVSKDGNQFVICSKDVTESLAKERQQQQQLENALQKAEVANSAKTSFLFNMSHDIRTPMNAITGFTTMAKKNISNTELALDYLNKIDVSGQQLLMLINQVLEMARIESGKIEFNEHPVNIRERYNVMVTVLSEQAAVHGLKFTSELKDIKHFNVFADDTRMSQITLNIVGNAIKYTPEGGSIYFSVKEIEARKEGYATFVFTVADTGIGMSKEYMKTLYDPFSREKSSTVSQIQGTGLGLSIVKNLVDLAGGRIEVESELGKGTRFDITLDLKINGQATEVEEVKLDISSFSLEGKRALLVEDNELNREIAKFILEDKGIAVEEAEDGDIAVQRIQELAAEGDYNYFDFILMDVQMPRMDGFEATARIRQILDPIVHIPIIALSANAFEEDRKKSHQAGMDDHIAKPIDVTVLWETLAKYL